LLQLFGEEEGAQGLKPGILLGFCGTAEQAAEKLIRRGTKRQGTTLVVP
jgi:hypothetical protein